MAIENTVLIAISLIIITVNSVASHNFEGFVVGGRYAKREYYPHVAHLYIECYVSFTSSYACGSSIINQAIILTAAHCLESCIAKYSYLTAVVGSSGSRHAASSYKLHEEFDGKEISSDIALVRLRNKLKFGRDVRRVSLMKIPPYKKYGKVAGWGFTDENDRNPSGYLMATRQRIRNRWKCIAYIDRMTPEGTICGGSKRSKSYITNGDSGSALVVFKYIQIGIVSYKDFARSRSLAVYTDVAYFYDWVQTNARKMYCNP